MTVLDSDAVLFGTPHGPGLWIADPDTAAPTGEDAPDGNTWTAVGYISEDGVPEVTNTVDKQAIRVWRKRLPHRYATQGQLVTVSFTLAEVNDAMSWLWWDQDPADVKIGAGAFREWAALLQVVDQGTLIRAWFPRTIVTGTEPLTFDKTAPVTAGITLTMLQSDLSEGTWERVAVTAPPVDYEPRDVDVAALLVIRPELVSSVSQPSGEFYPGTNTFPGTFTYPGSP